MRRVRRKRAIIVPRRCSKGAPSVRQRASNGSLEGRNGAVVGAVVDAEVDSSARFC